MSTTQNTRRATGRARGSSPARRGARRARCPSSPRTGRTPWPDAHPTRQGRPTPRAPLVFVFDVHRPPRRGGERGVNPEPSLDAGLLVGRQDILPRPERNPVPAPGVEFQDALGLGRKRRIAREDPTAMPPGAKGVLAEPAPQRGPADLGDQPLRDDGLPQITERPARQRHPPVRGQLTREGLDGDDDSGGKSGLAARLEAVPRGRAAGSARSVFSTC